MSITANRYHDFCAGHRVAGHENKCSNLHGHNYRIHFFVEPYPLHELDDIGRVIDFSFIKESLCEWVEKNWDHKMLIWEEDPIYKDNLHILGLHIVPFNPTAENMAKYIVETIAPVILLGTRTRLKKVVLEETRKCSVAYEL